MNLVERLGWLADKIPAFGDYGKDCANAMYRAADHITKLESEVRRLQSELEESDAVREKCARLLAETAVALKGEEKALHRHGWHDLPKVAAIMRAENTALRLYAPAQRAGAMQPPVQIAPTNWPAWGIVGIVQETDEEFSAKGRVYVEITR